MGPINEKAGGGGGRGGDGVVRVVSGYLNNDAFRAFAVSG